MSIFGSQRFLEERRSVTSPTFLNIFQSIIAYLVTILLFSPGYVLRSCRRVFCPIRSFLFPHPPHLWNPAYTRTRTYMQTPSVDACPECLIRRFQKYLVGGAAAATAAATEPPPSLDCSSPPTSFTYFSSPAAPKSSRRVAKFCRLSSSCFENKKRHLSFFLFERKKRKKIPSTHLVRLIDQRTISNLDCVSSILFRRRNENAIDTMTMCVIQIVPQFLDVSPTYRAEGGRSESWKGKDGMGGRPGNWGFQVDAPLRSLANEGSTPCAIPWRHSSALTPLPLRLLFRRHRPNPQTKSLD